MTTTGSTGSAPTIPCEVRHGVARVVEDLADVQQVVIVVGCVDEPLRKGHKRLDGHTVDVGELLLLPPIGLPPEAVELAVCGEDAKRSRQRGGEPDHQLVRVGSDGDGGRIRESEAIRDVPLHFRNDLLEDEVPLVVGMLGRVPPRLVVGRLRDIGPQVMGMCCEVEPVCVQEAPEPVAIAHVASRVGWKRIASAIVGGRSGRTERGMKNVERSNRSAQTRWRWAVSRR